MINDSEKAVQGRIGVKIRELRVAAGLTAVELARQAGLSQGQISKIETGKAALSIGALTSLCQILGRPLSYLFQKDEEIPRVLGTMTTVAGPESRGLAWFANEVRSRTGGRLSLVPLQATLLCPQTRQSAMLKDGFLDLFIEDLPAFRDLAPAMGLRPLPSKAQARFCHLRRQAFMLALCNRGNKARTGVLHVYSRSDHGFTIRMPAYLKSSSLRVTRLNFPCTTCAAINESIAAIFFPLSSSRPIKAPQLNMTSLSIGKMRPLNRMSKSSSSHSRRVVLRFESGSFSIPFRISPIVITLK